MPAARPDTQSADPVDTVHALNQLRAAGFTLSLEAGGLAVTPASQLTDDQRALIRAHKSALVALLTEPVPTEGESVQSMGLPTPAAVCCASCRHSAAGADTDPIYGWRLCKLRLEGGGGFGQIEHCCSSWEAGTSAVAAVLLSTPHPSVCHWDAYGDRLLTRCAAPEPNADKTGCANCGASKPEVRS